MESSGPVLSLRLTRAVRDGAARGLRTGAWLVALMVPISFIVAAMRHAGLLESLARVLTPVMGWLALPPEAALPLIAGGLVSCYTGIAAMAALTLTARQVTILALMILISHNLPVELGVQQRAGSSWPRLLALRIGCSLVGGLVLGRVLPEGGGHSVAATATAAAPSDVWGALGAWARDAAWLSSKVVVLVTLLMIVQRVIRELGVDVRLSRVLGAPLALLGLSRRTALLWVVANILGLAYGAGVLIEETRSGSLSRDESERLNRSVAVCHSLLEDTLLFVAVGAWAFWITIPRLVLAGGAVWGYRGWQALVRTARD
jgi:hypothetical protein